MECLALVKGLETVADVRLLCVALGREILTLGDSSVALSCGLPQVFRRVTIAGDMIV
eukprot:CAMPEP_0119507594 /NCGR_PEP_ID=MMETSP1344-20130328/27444_1 /TAXON_ID=236787 /ORGANISM="Florenciella parvula, Strain CCMP2471" /LENGTH=56 /DNA_ID=CAMNT_0007544239 /DNA_START=239 /DNA_END=409 /DNA_ORIENTATION=+